MEPFYSSKLLYNRAHENLDSFRILINSDAEKEYRIRVEQEKSGDYVVKCSFPEISSGELSVLAFDIVNELRSSLDHVVYEASRYLGGNPDPKYTKFPFGLTEDDAKKDLNRKKSDVPDAIKPYFMEFEPWKQGKYELYELNDLRNGKVHQLLRPVRVSSVGIGINSLPTSAELVSEWNEDHTELVVLRMRDRPNGRIAIRPDLVFAFELRGLANRPAFDVLCGFCATVKQIIFKIGSEAKRLKGQSAR